jgi:hypothetical protein
MSSDPVVRGAASCVAHAPDPVRYGSRPRREIALDPIRATLREIRGGSGQP